MFVITFWIITGRAAFDTCSRDKQSPLRYKSSKRIRGVRGWHGHLARGPTRKMRVPRQKIAGGGSLEATIQTFDYVNRRPGNFRGCFDDWRSEVTKGKCVCSDRV